MKKHPRLWAGVLVSGLVVITWFWNCLPDSLFNDPYCTVLQDRHGQLLGVALAKDEQWRFPVMEHVPQRFEAAISSYEDRRFRSHPGVDPSAVVRAIKQNIAEGRVVSGASTLTMQVIRLSRKGKPRVMREKLIEAAMALRLERSLTKDQILALYASHAPFGGNVVGLEAAAWRYFGRSAENLSWAETAMLAVLPNNPAMVHPGRHRNRLKTKRDGLIDRLAELGHLDPESAELAKMEPLPARPHPFPSLTPHLLAKAHQGPLRGSRIESHIDANLQQRAMDIVNRFGRFLATNQVHNTAAIILDNHANEVIAYVGNSGSYTDTAHGHAVDVIPAPRSTGSILKPFLHAAMLQDGALLPRMLAVDVPSRFSGYSPTNFDERFRGVIPADQALSRSLNVPAVRHLHHYGVGRLQRLLTGMGMTTLNRPADDYGLSLILGGAEGSLIDITALYGGMARVVTNHAHDGSYRGNNFQPPSIMRGDTQPSQPVVSDPPLRAGAAYATLQALTATHRPESRGLWRYFSSARRIAWKTGTSFGFRDAWAVGVTPEFTVGVWVGNADGEGRPGLTGGTTAAPIMFELYELLGPSTWFKPPRQDQSLVYICRRSGYLANPDCPQRERVWVPAAGKRGPPCPHHQMVFLDPSGAFQVHGNCESVFAMKSEIRFVLPPLVAWFYRQHSGQYRPLPPMRADCIDAIAIGDMDLIYPEPDTTIYLPRNLDGARNETLFELAHRDRDAVVFWHLNRLFIGTTQTFHQLAVNLPAGTHQLTVIDEYGQQIKRTFHILEDKEPRKMSRLSTEPTTSVE